MSIQQREQSHQGQRRFGLAVLVTREGIDTATEKFGGFALAEMKFLAYAGDKAGIDDMGIGGALRRAWHGSILINRMIPAFETVFRHDPTLPAHWDPDLS